MAKKLAQWELYSENSKGVFKCKVKEQAKNTKLFEGVTADGTNFKHYGYISTQLSGKLVWLDYIKGKFSNYVLVALENEKGIHQINIPINASLITDVVGALSNLKTFDTNISINHAIFDKTDENGNVSLNAKNEVKKVRKLFVYINGERVLSIWTKDNPKPAEAKWKKNAKGEWDDSNDISYMTQFIAEIQSKLIKSKQALPLNYGSRICTKVSDEFFTTLAPELVEKAKEIFTSKKSTFTYLQSSASSSNADDVFNDEPEHEVLINHPAPTIQQEEYDDLPF